MLHTGPTTTDEEDEDFSFQLEATTFKLPTIRWDYDVSPPPPPPVKFSAYEALIEADPHGFSRMSQTLDDLFPTLAHVATSSVGGSIKSHIVDFDMPAAAISRAFLSSVHMEKDSLGARVIESKHTGRWRYACLELFRYMHENTSPGTASQGYKTGEEEQHVEHSGRWDRNNFLYAMFTIELSLHGKNRLTSDDDATVKTFTPLELYDEVCGFGGLNGDGPAGWRVASEAAADRYSEYARSNGWASNPVITSESNTVLETDVASFAPIVGYGSLETLRSMKMARIHDCLEGFAPEDAELALVCQKEHRILTRNLEERAALSPFTKQRDGWCNPAVRLSVESIVGNPLQHQGDLFDTPLKHPFWIDAWSVDQSLRGEEYIDLEYKKHNLQSWVYVTSSGDPTVRAGMYRLADLPVFRSTPCQDLPNVRCSYSGYRLNGVTTPTYLNPTAELIDASNPEPGKYPFMIGREAVTRFRCSDAVAAAHGKGDMCLPGVNFDGHKPYKDFPTCAFSGDLLLLSSPGLYGTSFFYSRLGAIDPPPLPPPPPAPFPPPPPPTPDPPPSPPEYVDQLEVMRRIREAEERVCTSVYYLTQQTRCERLAIDLTQRSLITFVDPPSLPPFSPSAPSPPPYPGAPPLPGGVNAIDILSARLSTVREPAQGANHSDKFTVDSLVDLRESLATVSVDQRACVPDAPLACATGVKRDRCGGGMRHCGTEEENARDPFVEVGFALSRGRFFHGLRLVLPFDPQLSALFVGTYRVQLYELRDEPVACDDGLDKNEYDIPVGGIITVGCEAVGMGDPEYLALSRVSKARITLPGAFRQLWLSRIQVLERPLVSTGITTMPSPPPSPPPTPSPPPLPVPSPPPSTAYQDRCNGTFGGYKAWYNRDKWPDMQLDTSEACGNTPQSCCEAAYEKKALGFEIDDSGCCVLLRAPRCFPNVTATELILSTRPGAWSRNAGIGFVDKEVYSGCRG
jgi:hypothetical protein